MARVAPRILVADDDPRLRELLVELLRELGYQPSGAADGYEALAQAHATSPALILLDYNMPGLDGLAVLRALKADPHLRGAAVIIITGVTGDLPPFPGAAAILRKPFRVDELRQLVQTLLAGPAG